MKVKYLIYNWHQAGSVQDRDGCGEGWEKVEVDKNGVSLIEECKDGVFSYLIHRSDGTKARIFNPNYVEYLP